MEPSPGLSRFSEVVRREDFQLDHAALLIGAWDFPERDLEGYREALDGIANRVRPDVARATNGIGRARAISDWLFDRMGYVGNTDDYYDPKNSFLAEVIDRRTGIPISLSVLYLEVALGVVPCADQQRRVIELKVVPPHHLAEPGQSRARFHSSRDYHSTTVIRTVSLRYAKMLIPWLKSQDLG